MDDLLEVLPGGFNAIPDIAARRTALQAMLDAIDVPDNPNVLKQDRAVPGPDGAPAITVRVYRPRGSIGPLPGVYFIHGGGMVLGNIEGEDPVASTLCAAVGAVVVSVQYRLTPESPYPAGLELRGPGLDGRER